MRAAAAEYMTAGTAYPPDPARVVVSAGAKQSLFNACFCLFGPGDEVLIASPYWTSYPEMVTLARAEPVPVAGSESRDFNLTPDDLEAAATSRTRGLILSTPSNPTGAVYSGAELGALAKWAGKRGVTLISDEIYREIHYGEGDRAPGALDLDPDAVGGLVVANGMSKAFAMTGWRVGFSYTTPELAAKMSALQSHVSLNAATPSQVAALEGLTRGGEGARDLARMRAAFRRRRDLVARLFDELLPDCFYVRPEGAFYLYFRVDHLFDGEVACAADVLHAHPRRGGRRDRAGRGVRRPALRAHEHRVFRRGDRGGRAAHGEGARWVKGGGERGMRARRSGVPPARPRLRRSTTTDWTDTYAASSPRRTTACARYAPGRTRLTCPGSSSPPPPPAPSRSCCAPRAPAASSKSEPWRAIRRCGSRGRFPRTASFSRSRSTRTGPRSRARRCSAPASRTGPGCAWETPSASWPRSTRTPPSTRSSWTPTRNGTATTCSMRRGLSAGAACSWRTTPSGAVACSIPRGSGELAAQIHDFNESVAADPRFEATILPVGDGLMVAVRG